MDKRSQDMEVESFFDNFVPGDDPTPEERAQFLVFEEDDFKKKEKEMAAALCRVSNSVLNVNPNNDLLARHTSDWPDSTDAVDGSIGKKRPDVVLYPKDDEAQEDYKLQGNNNDGDANSLDDDESMAQLARVRWAWMCVPIELKTDRDLAPFEFGPGSDKYFYRSALEKRKARGQIADYAARLMRRQHREFCFMIVICKSEARLVRWDRAGAIVTNPFDFVADPDYMYRFLYRLSKMNRHQRGYDPTVEPASKEEINMMQACRETLQDPYLRECLDQAMSPGWPISKVKFRQEDVVCVESWQSAGGDNCSDSSPALRVSASRIADAPLATCTSSTSSPSSPEHTHVTSPQLLQPPRSFLTGKHVYASLSPDGRGTKCYIAYDLTTGKLVFLKDSWRAEMSKSEIEVYERLWRKGVGYIATPVCGGDVIGERGIKQQTRTQEFSSRTSVRIHCRLVVQEIARPLKDYKSSRILVSVMMCALTAHRDAWERAGVMHRDVSAANILIVDPVKGLGILNDWDLCKYDVELQGGATQDDRSGTWPFMSAMFLRYPGKKPYELSDDLESFVHILNWFCLRYHPHNCLTDLQTHVEYVYHGMEIDSKQHIVIGGHQKLRFLKSGQLFVELSDASPLKTLVEDLARICREHYAKIDLSKFDVVKKTDRAIDSDGDGDAGLAAITKFAKTQYADTQEVVKPSPQVGIAEMSSNRPPALSTHRAIMYAFACALETKGTWLVDKQGDQFVFRSGSREPPVRSSIAMSDSSLKRKPEDAGLDREASAPRKLPRSEGKTRKPSGLSKGCSVMKA